MECDSIYSKPLTLTVLGNGELMSCLLAVGGWSLCWRSAYRILDVKKTGNGNGCKTMINVIYLWKSIEIYLSLGILNVTL